ncbi:hypothetical protein [Yinghuangia sp. YIM S09857]|uniref:hypothetical protein n=1 Tax=Yinghuangia sp. YIM S09857 TaxID=3436929 RepID=UPI003F53CD1E
MRQSPAADVLRRVAAHPAARCAASCLVSAALRRLNAHDAERSGVRTSGCR